MEKVDCMPAKKKGKVSMPKMLRSVYGEGHQEIDMIGAHYEIPFCFPILLIYWYSTHFAFHNFPLTGSPLTQN